LVICSPIPRINFLSCTAESCRQSLRHLHIKGLGLKYLKQIRPAENIVLETIEALPPRYAVLLQHTLMSAFQAGFCSGQSIVAVPNMPSAGDYRSTRRSEQDPCYPLWTTLLSTAKSCMELIKRGCSKKGCAKANVRVSRLTSPAQNSVHGMVCVTGLKCLCQVPKHVLTFTAFFVNVFYLILDC